MNFNNALMESFISILTEIFATFMTVGAATTLDNFRIKLLNLQSVVERLKHFKVSA